MQTTLRISRVRAMAGPAGGVDGARTASACLARASTATAPSAIVSSLARRAHPHAYRLSTQAHLVATSMGGSRTIFFFFFFFFFFFLVVVDLCHTKMR